MANAIAGVGSIYYNQSHDYNAFKWDVSFGCPYGPVAKLIIHKLKDGNIELDIVTKCEDMFNYNLDRLKEHLRCLGVDYDLKFGEWGFGPAHLAIKSTDSAEKVLKDLVGKGCLHALVIDMIKSPSLCYYLEFTPELKPIYS